MQALGASLTRTHTRRYACVKYTFGNPRCPESEVKNQSVSDTENGRMHKKRNRAFSAGHTLSIRLVSETPSIAEEPEITPLKTTFPWCEEGERLNSSSRRVSFGI